MRQVMNIIQKMAVDKGVWKPRRAGDDYWNSKTVLDMWNGIYDTVSPYLMTVTKRAGQADSTHKSRPDDQAWRTTLRKFKAAIKKGESAFFDRIDHQRQQRRERARATTQNLKIR